MRFGKMKLMGTIKLQQLAHTGAAGVAGAVAALYAELKVAVLPDANTLLEFYPSTKIKGPQVEIPIDAENTVIALVDYQTGCMLIQNAGPCVRGAKGGKRK